MKRIKYLLVLLLALVPFVNVYAKTTTTKAESKKEPITFYIFYGSTCGYCAALHEYTAKLESDTSINYMFNIVDYEVWANETNSSLMSAVAESFGEQATGVPYYVIGDKSFTGFSEENYGEQIRQAIKDAYNNKKYVDVVAKVAKSASLKPVASDPNGSTGNGENFGSTSEEEKDNSVTGYIILAVTAVAIVLVVLGRGKSSNEIYEIEEEVEAVETVEEEKAPAKTEVKKTVKKTAKKTK